MSENREEILANFQECTGIENVEEAIMWLEAAQWDLFTAINNAVPQEAQMGMYGAASNKNEYVGAPVTISNDFVKLPSTSADQRTLEIHVHYRSNVYKLRVPDSMTVSCLKTLIFSDTSIPPCQQVITGWNSQDGAPLPQISDKMSLQKLNMPDLTHLYLNTPMPTSFAQTNEMDIETEVEGKHKKQRGNFPDDGDNISLPSGSREKWSGAPKVKSDGDQAEILYSLKIHDGNQNKEHNITAPGSQTVVQIKKDVVNLTGIPLSQQTWLGWPDDVSDSAKLSEMHLDWPLHHLTVVRLEEDTRNTRSKNRRLLDQLLPSPERSDSGADTDSFEDASESFSVEDEMFNDETTVSNRSAPLMPNNVEDETIGSVTFIDGYTSRYGQMSPNFFSGPLENAMNEAFLKNGREKKMLALYLHHDGSILTNVFCSQLLGSESILQLFATYFVLWGWDVTNYRNREMLLDSVSRLLGQTVLQAVSSIRTDDFPALLIISRMRSNVEILNVIRGNIGATELSTSLVNTIDLFSSKLEAEIQNEEERAARDQIKYEQDMAYQESLILDKAKDESRRQQLLLQEQEEERLKRAEELRAAEKLAVESRLPEEPTEETSSKEIMTFRFRTPTGDFFIRKFRVSETLQTVFDYLLVKGFRIDEYKVISPFPRKDLSALEGSLILKDVGLCQQETLTLEER